jgi:hypothetical protein
MVQGLLDAEEAIEEHNRRHPEHSMADVKYMLRQFCGDCTRERATRDLELREEAQNRPEQQPSTPATTPPNP